ncbi:MAG TPA: hypothetical protein VER33_19740 [Polyangiaceae bacterium]|nr:hypothetical protein [Polyangiaceae bacterium]
MAKSSAKRRSVAPPARRTPEVAAAATPARRSAPPEGRASARPPAPAAAAAPAKRKFRGAAPWAARHAAKHAAEAAARNQEPPRPGSARSTLRTPEEAEGLKARVIELHELLTRLRAFKKQLPDRFYEIGGLLRHIRDGRLFEAKGYASFEAFVERELDLGGKTMSLRLTRIPEVFIEEAARSHGLDALLAGLEAMEQAAQRAQRVGIRPPAPGRAR